MKTGMGLTLIGIGLILTFAVTANTSVFNLHAAGVVFVLIGILGLVIPRRGYAWLGRRVVVRRRRRLPGGQLEETIYPPYFQRDPASKNGGIARVSAITGVPPDPPEAEPGETNQADPGAEAEREWKEREAANVNTEIVEEAYDD